MPPPTGFLQLGIALAQCTLTVRARAPWPELALTVALLCVCAFALGAAWRRAIGTSTRDASTQCDDEDRRNDEAHEIRCIKALRELLRACGAPRGADDSELLCALEAVKPRMDVAAACTRVLATERWRAERRAQLSPRMTPAAPSDAWSRERSWHVRHHLPSPPRTPSRVAHAGAAGARRRAAICGHDRAGRPCLLVRVEGELSTLPDELIGAISAAPPLYLPRTSPAPPLYLPRSCARVALRSRLSGRRASPRRRPRRHGRLAAGHAAARRRRVGADTHAASALPAARGAGARGQPSRNDALVRLDGVRAAALAHGQEGDRARRRGGRTRPPLRPLATAAGLWR